MSIYDLIAGGGAVGDFGGAVDSGIKTGMNIRDLNQQNAAINIANKYWNEVPVEDTSALSSGGGHGHSSSVDNPQPITKKVFDWDGFKNELASVDPARAAEFEKALAERNGVNGGRKIVGTTVDPDSGQTYGHILEPDGQINTIPLIGRPSSIINSDPNRRGAQSYATGVGENAADMGAPNPYTDNGNSTNPTQKPFSVEDIENAKRTGINTADEQAEWIKKKDLNSQFAIKSAPVIEALKGDQKPFATQIQAATPNLSAFLNGKSVVLNNLFAELGVDKILENSQNTKGAISDREMALFSTGVPPASATNQIKIQWLENVNKIARKINAWVDLGRPDLTNPKMKAEFDAKFDKPVSEQRTDNAPKKKNRAAFARGYLEHIQSTYKRAATKDDINAAYERYLADTQ